MRQPPRQIREFTVIEPSGRRFYVRQLAPAQRVRAAVAIGALLVISLALWAVILSPVWRSIAGMFR